MIHVEHLVKRYGRQTVVDDISFSCRPGTITGFLGPNGAGKSTTLRMMTGLTPPSAGRVTIDGMPYAAHPNPGRVIGVMLDASAQHPGRSGIETLRLTARLLGLPRTRAAEMLERVGLGGAAKRRVGDYSLGMRQRLGIGTALMGDPAVLILDEPANGMDPEGIRWMRMLLQDFAAGGGTVLLSSHLLAEAQATVDRLVVIGRGRILADDALESLLAGQGTTVRGLDPTALDRALRTAGFETTVASGGARRVQATAEQVGRVALASRQVLLELREGDGSGLEELFFELTGPGTGDTQATAA
jgi:ABC-2 type transport system ATP-binding protein